MKGEDWFAMLGLGPSATPEQVKEAYRDLTKVWHPDRFGGDARLQKKAEEKLKGINRAYEELRSTRSTADTDSRSATGRSARTGGAASTPDHQARRSASSTQVEKRPVRMPLPHVDILVDAHRGTLVDLSVTGGQLLLDAAPPVGSHVRIQLNVLRESLELLGQVVRTSPVASRGYPSQWAVGVTFVQLSAQARQAIPKFYNLLLRARR